MKRIILIIGALLIGFVMQAQSVTYTCRYWFDKNQEQAVTATFSDSIWQAELDVGLLPEGLHTLYLHVMDTSMRWGAPQSFLFLKTSSTQPSDLSYHYWFDQNHEQMQSGTVGNGILLLDLDSLNVGLHTLHVMLKDNEYSASQSYLFLKTHPTGQGTTDFVYHCWFNQDIEHKQSNSLGSGNVLLDVADLEDGMHTINVMLEGDALTSTQSFLFMKVAAFDLDTADMSHLVYHCWFDQDFENQQTDSLRDGHFLLDVDGLVDGLHTVNVMLEGGSGTLTTTQSYMFMKIAAQDPSVAMQYRCWFDQDYSTMQTGPVGAGVFELEVGDLKDGLHTVFVQMDNGAYATPQCYMFYKRPVGGYITKWEYWLNGDFDSRVTTNLMPRVDTLDIVTLLPVGHPALRSSCFHFHPNGEEPYLNAKNELTVRIWNTEEYYKDLTAFYVDEQVQQEIVAQVFERNTTETFAAPRDNQIQWFKLDAVVGDSLSFVASKACTMQLFAPSGEEVFNVSGPESITLRGLHAWEDGTYYLAVHDQTGGGDELSVTYNWVYRYAILAYDVHLVGNGGCSTITFQGNGFNSLLDAYLVNYQNDTIHRLDIGHESNTTTTVTFNFYEVNLGVYDMVFQFYEEDIRINGALEVQEPVDIVLTSTVSYPATFRRDTECTYTYTITNNGNMSAYRVPFFVYISTPTRNGISHLEFEGFELPSLYDYLYSDTLSLAEKKELRLWSEELGDDFNFYDYYTVDEDTGDSIVVKSNFFFLNLAPYETKTLFLKLTANELLDVYFNTPNEIVQPIIIDNRNIADQYCCVKDQITCVLDIFCNLIDMAGLISGAFPNNPVDISISVASCICSLASMVNSTWDNWLCENEDPKNLFEMMHRMNMNSIIGAATTCLKRFIPGAKYQEIANVISGLKNASGVGWIETAIDCWKKMTKKDPDCPPGDHDGGPSTPVAPCEPNEIRGYLAESGSHYMMQEIQTITYEIESENDTTATAAAHTIIVRDTLDVNKFDVASLAAYRVTIHDKVLELSGEHNFVYTLDLRPNVYVIAQIQLECDDETGIVVWTITSLDPMTMEPTTDPNQGALPINYNGEGIATFTFNVNLKEPFPDGTEISNRVGIIFDLEEPVITDTWTNIIDAVKPTSHIEEVTPVADSLSFSFVSEDNRSGVWYHTLYYRNDSTQMEWQVKKSRIFENSYMLPIDSLQTTGYLVIAVDSAGNQEEKPMNPEYVFSPNGSLVNHVHDVNYGWNWYSTFIELNNIDGLSMLEEQLGENAESINSQTAFTMYYGEYGWYGSLENINNESMYRLKMIAPSTINMTGLQADPLLHPISITKGWNHIGFLSSVPLEVNQAFAGLDASQGDLVKNQSKYATYYDGYGWYGSLTSNGIINPGDGLMYKSEANENKMFTYPTNPTRGAHMPMESEAKHWTNDAYAYPNNMTMLAVAELEGKEINSDDYEIAAFAEDGCRGSVRLQYVEPIQKHVAFLTIAGDESVELKFRLYNTVTGEEYYAVQSVDFNTDAMVGSFAEPYLVRFNGTGIVENACGLAFYPNPVEKNQSFTLNLPQDEVVTEITIIDVLGAVVCYERGKMNLSAIKGLPIGGVYVIEVVAKSGNTYRGRLIVK